MAEPRMYTPAEKRRKARLVLVAVRKPEGSRAHERAMDGIDAINAAAEERCRREFSMWEDQLAAANAALSAARTAERCASRAERGEARKARREAEAHLKRVERARPRI